MEKINLLDCTLRDGGYINDWRFGKEAIADMTEKLADTHVEVLEIGFLKDEPYQKDRTVFNSMEQVKKLIAPKKPGVQYAVMCEVVNPLPLDMLDPADGDSADIIRVIVWKTKHDSDGNVVDALDEGFAYCKGIVEKGYKLCVQPARVDQYTDEEFVAMVRRFAQLNPMAIYVVDSWGTQNPENLLHYMHLADENMDQSIILGYHGHNNMMQALSVAQAMIKENFDRDIMIDASVYGIGRGAGNLNLEIIAKYMNEHCGKGYNVAPMLEVNDRYIQDIYKTEQWGYSISYYLTAKHNCNPNYARFYTYDIPIPSDKMESVLVKMTKEERVMFSKKNALSALDRAAKKKLAIGIATDSNWGNVETLLNTPKLGLTYSGANIVVLDYGCTDHAKIAVENFLLERCRNISYQKVHTPSSQKAELDDLMREFLEENSDAEYLWFMKDSNCINFYQMDKVLRRVEGENVSCILFNPYPSEVRDLAEDLIVSVRDVDIVKYYESFIAAGAVIVHRDMAKKMLEQTIPTDVNGFWQFWSIMAVAEKEQVEIFISRDSLFTSNWAPKNRCADLGNKNLAEVWGRQWCSVLRKMPEFCADKTNSLTNLKELGMVVLAPFEIFAMRSEGLLTRKTVDLYGDDIERVSPGTVRMMRLALMVPRFICRFLLKHKGSKVIRALRSLI